MSTQENKIVSRLVSIDALKGFCMLVMALDHANYFIAHKDPISEFWAGPNPSYQSALQMFTRLLSHPAAPGFFFLMGLGMSLFIDSRLKKGWSKWQTIKHFLIRGLVLILVQLLIENRLWEIRPTGENWNCYFGVLYGLGFSMMVGSLLSLLPSLIILLFSLLTLLSSEIILKYFIINNEQLPLLTRMLIAPGTTPGQNPIDVYYPLIPWVSVVGLGMLFGRKLKIEKALHIGLLLLSAFVVIRSLNGFGNMRSTDHFLTIIKYPPSIAFLCFTLGINFLLLAFFSHQKVSQSFLTKILAQFGQVPFFFYLAHLLLFGIISLPLGQNGTALWIIYPVWIIAILLLYKPCLSYSFFKQSKPVNSLWRLF